MPKQSNNYGLKVEKTLITVPTLDAGYTTQYCITEDGIPLYEVNRWIQTMSSNSYLTGKHYAYCFVHFLRYLKAHKIHYREVTSKIVIENYIKYLLYGDIDISNIEGNESLNAIKQRISIIKGFYEWLEEQGEISVNPVTYGSKKNNKTNRTALKSKFLYGQVWDFEIEKSPISKLRYKKRQNHIKWYSDDEIADILHKLPTLRDKLIFKITIETGTRIGETLGLHLIDFDSSKGVLSIRKNPNIENESLVKTTERDLFISERLADELSTYIRGERAENDLFFSDYLFLNQKGPSKGNPVSSKNFLAILKRAGVKVGFNAKEIRTHSGRSTHAQKLLDALHDGDVSEVYILQQMGWEHISTLKPYVKSYNEKNRIRVAKEINEKRIHLPSLIKQEERETVNGNENNH